MQPRFGPRSLVVPGDSVRLAGRTVLFVLRYLSACDAGKQMMFDNASVGCERVQVHGLLPCRYAVVCRAFVPVELLVTAVACDNIGVLWEFWK